MLDYVGATGQTLFGSNDKASTGAKMDLWFILLIGLSLFCTAISFYSIGYKDGRRQGYTRGRSVSRHVSNTMENYE